MRTTRWTVAILAAAVLATAGCSKASKPQPTAASELMDMGKLQQTFQPPSPDFETSLTKLRFALRYGEFDTALAELDKLANTAGITEAQKKAVNDKIDQVRQAISAANAKTPQ